MQFMDMNRLIFLEFKFVGFLFFKFEFGIIAEFFVVRVYSPE